MSAMWVVWMDVSAGILDEIINPQILDVSGGSGIVMYHLRCEGFK